MKHIRNSYPHHYANSGTEILISLFVYSRGPYSTSCFVFERNFFCGASDFVLHRYGSRPWGPGRVAGEANLHWPHFRSTLGFCFERCADDIFECLVSTIIEVGVLREQVHPCPSSEHLALMAA